MQKQPTLVDIDHRCNAFRKIDFALYLNSTRAELLVTVDLAVATGKEPHSFYERGVTVLISTATN